ncbi:T9SS type A sorting domain-containing protein [bacterium]|nr:T9SS type A sorting domain-containing protein [bacterium]
MLNKNLAGLLFFYVLTMMFNLITADAQPIISPHRDKLHFGSQLTNAVTSPQKLFVENAGTDVMNWTTTSDQDWLKVEPGSAINTDVMKVWVDPVGLMPGTYTGSLSISSPGAINDPETVTVELQVHDQSSPPFGTFDIPMSGSTFSGSIPVAGWALDDIEVETVQIFKEDAGGANREYIGDALLIEGSRPDVAQAYPDYPRNYKAGWGYMLLTNFMPNGTYNLEAIAIDRESNEVSLGTKTIHVDNANAVKPFGAIDTPEQGGIASGTNYVNRGWVLTPQPNTIPQDGSTIYVYVDGVKVGNPTYNIYREDIASLLPDYHNASGAEASFELNTTEYSNGVHHIQWTASDNAGNTDGIGSRYFTILNLDPSSDVEDEEPGSTIPTSIELEPVYPNPFNPHTTITYSLSKDEIVNLSLYDINGRQVKVLVANEYQQPGRYNLDWQGVDSRGNQVSSGLYLLVFRAGATVRSQKVTLLR